MRAQSLSHVWLCNTMDCSLPGFSVHGIFQTRRLEWVAISFSRGSSRPRDRTCVFCIGRQILTQESNQKCLVSSRKTQAELWEVASIESEWLRWGTKKKKQSAWVIIKDQMTRRVLQQRSAWRDGPHLSHPSPPLKSLSTILETIPG